MGLCDKGSRRKNLSFLGKINDPVRGSNTEIVCRVAVRQTISHTKSSFLVAGQQNLKRDLTTLTDNVRGSLRQTISFQEIYVSQFGPYDVRGGSSAAGRAVITLATQYIRHPAVPVGGLYSTVYYMLLSYFKII